MMTNSSHPPVRTPVRTRFAPSPTGYLHVGGARTALYCWAFSRHYGGEFILRIEDTDLERSTPEAVQAILDGMAWLGLNPDEGPFYQMQRMDRYREVIAQMVASGAAYFCYSSPKELEAMREDQFPVCRIHSGMEKNDRMNAFNDFKSGASRVLISSNVTSRGIDIQQVSIVMNFDIPKCVHNYLHRIGRSGRWGRKGVGINFITRRDLMKMKEIEAHYSTQINEMPSDLGFLITC